MPVYLLAGQSNMVGYVEESLLRAFVAELSSGAANLEARLDDRLWAFYQSIDPKGEYYTRSGSEYQKFSEYEISELLRLHREGLVGDALLQSHRSVMCSFNGSSVAALQANCGAAFGPELMMGHVLSKTLGSPTSLIKVAEGGTTLRFDWTSPSRRDQPVGEQYKRLSERIKLLASNPAQIHPDCASKQCRWAAFVYFQGENDAFDDLAAAAYESNLRALISDVRSEVGNPTLPVVVVQVGAWGSSVGRGNLVAAAQQAVVQSDAHARLVVTSDLSTYYHYDSAAQLIIGERVAKAVQALTVEEAKQ